MRYIQGEDRTQGALFPVSLDESAVDAKHRLIVHHEVTQEGTDNRQLEPMAASSRRVKMLVSPPLSRPIEL